MKKTFSILALALTTTVTASAQHNITPLCVLSPWQHNFTVDAPATPVATQQMLAVQNALCSRFPCAPYSFTKNSTIQNAAVMTSNGQIAIKYNPAFMNQVAGAYGNLATVGIFAHELGHIIDFTLNPNPATPRTIREANADRYAGCAFKIAGNSLQDLQPLAQTLHALGASPGYPTPSQRTALLKMGFESC